MTKHHNPSTGLFAQDHYELIEMFERTFKGDFRLDREDKAEWSKGRIYQSGDANRTFLAYRKGYAFGITKYQG
ncbi:MAG: hypothetical protein AB7R40_23840 [Nitrospiraceae bacterium]